MVPVFFDPHEEEMGEYFFALLIHLVGVSLAAKVAALLVVRERFGMQYLAKMMDDYDIQRFQKRVWAPNVLHERLEEVSFSNSATSYH